LEATLEACWSGGVDRFNATVASRDLDALACCVHPDFEMIVPQQPARGFTGHDQEVANIRFLLDSIPTSR
jgi:hypothetical protein